MEVSRLPSKTDSREAPNSNVVVTVIISNTVLAAASFKIGNEWFSVVMVVVVVPSNFLLFLSSSSRREAPSASPRQEIMQPLQVPQQPQQASLVKIENDRDVRDDIVTTYPRRDMDWNA